MWLFTQHGFFSIVQEEEGLYHVYAHTQRDLDNLLKLVDLKLRVRDDRTVSPRYWILIDLETFLEVMVHLTTNLNYPAFTDRLLSLPDQSHRVSHYRNLWNSLCAAERPANAPGIFTDRSRAG